MSGNSNLYDIFELDMEKALTPELARSKPAQQGDQLVDEEGKPPVTHDYGFTWQQTHGDN